MTEQLHLQFSMPMRVDSETNAREHWSKKYRRKKKQQDWLLTAWLEAIIAEETQWPIKFPCIVRLTRIGPKNLDSDNLVESFKAIRDAIAWTMDIDDGDERIKWEYAQEAVGKRQYAVKVEVYSYDT